MDTLCFEKEKKIVVFLTVYYMFMSFFVRVALYLLSLCHPKQLTEEILKKLEKQWKCVCLCMSERQRD